MSLLISVVDMAFRIYSWIIFVRVILSFVRHNPYHPVIRFIYEITEPVLAFFRRFIPPVGMIDFSPIVVFFVIELVRSLSIRVLIAVFGHGLF